ncbi:hypothetical protein VP1G_11490 [Cytospora mali]|uniref:Uncharacterized protein n=1 Tax=Cytospora mali TaxID=578113 RepID=A0A194VG41_CYTMA|nr:hypothetical protein VP1G_11490 [Valsa mali var. pyri (nom. inval.)]
MANLAQGWINHLRRQAKVDQTVPSNSKDPTSKDEGQQQASNDDNTVHAGAGPRRSPAAAAAPSAGVPAEDVAPARKRFKSPTASPQKPKVVSGTREILH